MASLAVNSLMQNLAKQNLLPLTTKPPIIDRTHYSGPSGGGYHYHSGHGYGGHGSGKKHSVALTALTLLSFLFFLNILQNCIQDHMDSMNPPQQVVIMQARLKAARDAEAEKRKGEAQSEFLNSTLLKESRHNLESYDTMAQIPVKLKTAEKTRKP